MLKINRLTLENFCQHEYVDVAFTDGLTVVLGPNGSGKSNFLGGIYSAFTGQFDRGPGEIAEHIRKNQNGSCSTQVLGTVGGREFRLRRDLHVTADGRGKVDHGLWLDGERRKSCKTASEIESWMMESSGLTSALMSEFLFIGQEDLFGFLKRNDADRSKKFTALCGTKPYDRIRENFSEHVKDDRTRYDKAVLAIDLVQKAFETSQADLDAIETELHTVRSGGVDVNATPEVLESRLQQVRETLRECEEQEAAVNRYSHDRDSALARLARAKQAYWDQERIVTFLQQDEESHTAATKLLEWELTQRLGGVPWEEATATLHAALRTNEKRESLTNRITETQRRLAAIPSSPPMDERIYLQREKERDTLIARLGELESHLQSLRSMIDVLHRLSHRADREHSCPLCGADADNWKVDLTTLTEKEDALTCEHGTHLQRCSELSGELAVLVQTRERIEREQHQRAELTQWLTQFESELAGCPVFDPGAEKKLAALTALEQELRESRQSGQVLRDRIHREWELLNTWKLQQDSCQSELDRLEHEFKALNLRTPEVRRNLLDGLRNDIKTVEAQLTAARQFENRITALQGARDEALRQVRKHQTELEAHRQSLSSFGNASLWFAKCDRAIDWLKKDGLPRLVHRSVLNELVTAINDELACFADPFRVKVNDDVTFTAIFDNGNEIRSRALSGGEKYMLGLAFLSAVNRTFARNLGIMFIDEPTASLDARHVQLLFRILGQWKNVLLSRSQQLIVVTHVEDMAQVADSVVRFGD